MANTTEYISKFNGKTIKDKEARTTIGDTTLLNTEEKSTIVGAINELAQTGGDLSSLSTTNKGNLVEAINELKETANKFSYYEAERLESDANDNAVIERTLNGATVDKGSIFVIKKAIGADTYSYTGYVYNGTTWAAMDGNYSADNIYFSKDLIYTAPIGVLTVPASGSGTIKAANKNLTNVMSSIMAEEKNPIITKPSASIKLTPSGAKEVGTEVTPSYVSAFNPGAYTYDTSTGVTATAWSITDTNGNTSTTQNGSFDAFIVEDNTDYKVSVTADYTDGDIPHTNIPNEYPDGQIKAGTTAVANSSNITGFRKYFYGSLITVPSTYTSEVIRALANSTSVVGSSKTFNMPVIEGAKAVIIAFPTNINKTLKKVEDVGAFGTDIVGKFTKSTVDVNGYNNYTAISYDVYTYLPDTALGTNTYNVTIS